MDASALPCLPLPDISLCICAHVSPSKDTSRTGSGPTLKASPGSSAEAHITRSLGRAPVLELWEDTAQFTAGDLGMETDLSQQRSCERRRGRRRPPPQGRTSAHLASCPPPVWGGGRGGFLGFRLCAPNPGHHSQSLGGYSRAASVGQAQSKKALVAGLRAPALLTPSHLRHVLGGQRPVRFTAHPAGHWNAPPGPRASHAFCSGKGGCPVTSTGGQPAPAQTDLGDLCSQTSILS